jgi:hypothetical protein
MFERRAPAEFHLSCHACLSWFYLPAKKTSEIFSLLAIFIARFLFRFAIGIWGKAFSPHQPPSEAARAITHIGKR